MNHCFHSIQATSIGEWNLNEMRIETTQERIRLDEKWENRTFEKKKNSREKAKVKERKKHRAPENYVKIHLLLLQREWFIHLLLFSFSFHSFRFCSPISSSRCGWVSSGNVFEFQFFSLSLNATISMYSTLSLLLFSTLSDQSSFSLSLLRFRARSFHLHHNRCFTLAGTTKWELTTNLEN